MTCVSDVFFILVCGTLADEAQIAHRKQFLFYFFFTRLAIIKKIISDKYKEFGWHSGQRSVWRPNKLHRVQRNN